MWKPIVLSVMRVALVHHWLMKMRGGEKVLEALCEIFPNADLFTLVMNKTEISETIKRHKINTSFIQRLPFAQSNYQSYLPLMPTAVEHFDLNNYDIVITSDASVMKGAVTRPDTLHICYCHSPVRYAWDLYHEYMNNSGMGYIKRKFAPVIMNYLRVWDSTASMRVDCFIANSEHTKKRIKKYYRRDSEVIYPPVDWDRFQPSAKKGDYYLFLGQLVPYKRAELAVQAFNNMGKKLKIVGTGDKYKTIQKLASSNVEVMGYRNREEIVKLLAEAKAVVFPGEEDFGIVPIEAQASGTPVIAYGRGGALETVIGGFTNDIPTPEHTGVFFKEQTVEDICAAVNWFEKYEHIFNSSDIRAKVKKFGKVRFKKQIEIYINKKWSEFMTDGIPLA